MKDKADVRKGRAGQRPAGPALEIENERANFKMLVLANPNHFGNMPNLGFPEIKAMTENTTYEELTCLGLHPQGEKLQAVVNIKKHFGYAGSCPDGSVEYVRFFVKRASGWHDLGLATFTSRDLPPGSPLPVSYSVEMDMAEARRYCTTENVLKVRAILSWNQEPPAGDETWTPPWGNVRDSRVQIAPREPFKVSINELIGDKLIAIDPSILGAFDLTETIKPLPPPPPKTYSALKEKYKGQDVPGHRFGFSAVQRLLKQPLSATKLATVTAPVPAGKKDKKAEAAPPLAATLFKDPDLAVITDLGSWIGDLVKTKGNTTFEELECAGYNPETRTLSAVIQVKKNNGYSGDLCDPGSTEYVGFWVFYSGAWHSLGTAQVQVHDLAEATDKAVRYAVYRGANLPEHVCEEIQGLPLRAILSWENPPLTPDDDPVWGNVVDTHVQPIITDVPIGDQRVRLMRVNRVTITKINGSGFAGYSDIAGDCDNGNDSPFGGSVLIEGDFTVKSDSYFDPVTGDILPGQHPPAYQVFVHKVGDPAAPTQLTNSFNIAVFPVNPPPLVPAVTVTQSIQPIGGDQYYLYREGVIQAVNPRMLAVWEASGLAEGQYDIEVKGFVWNGVTYVPMATPSQTKRVYIYNGYPHTEIDINGDPFTINRPQVSLRITSVTHLDGTSDPAEDCGDVTVGDVLHGNYQVTDHFFSSLGLGLVEITVGGIPQPLNAVVPSGPTAYPAAGTGGTGGTWTLNTAGMTPCGYTIVLSAWDRALVGGSCLGHYNQIGVGFCLREP